MALRFRAEAPLKEIVAQRAARQEADAGSGRPVEAMESVLQAPEQVLEHAVTLLEAGTAVAMLGNAAPHATGERPVAITGGTGIGSVLVEREAARKRQERARLPEMRAAYGVTEPERPSTR